MQRFELDAIEDDLVIGGLMQQRYDMNVEERAVQQYEYDQQVQQEIQVDRQIAYQQYRNEPIVYIQNNDIENELIVDEEINQQQKIYKQERMIENIEYNEYRIEQNQQRLQNEIIINEVNSNIYNQIREQNMIENNLRRQDINNQLQMQQINRNQQRKLNHIQSYTQQNQIINSNQNCQLQSPIYFSSFFQWKQGLGAIRNSQIIIGDKILKLSDITKIKINKQLGMNNSRRIKLTYLTNDTLFSIDINRIFGQYPLHYYWFAKIITQKLYLKGCDLQHPFIIQKNSRGNNLTNILIDGNIYKQSQYFKSWELRYVTITTQGLFSYKQNSMTQSFTIKRDASTQLWTRFDFHERMLVIKLHHNGRKTEFGIPIMNYCQKINNWLYQFYRMVFPS